MTPLPQSLEAALHSQNVLAFLRLIRAGETSQEPDAYRMQFGGGLVESLSNHPRTAITRPLGAKTLTSTAAGAYQFLSRTWDECANALRLPDFGPASQDLAAVYLIDRRKALDDVLAGRIAQAVAKCNREWASLPGSPYGQPTRTMQQALATYTEFGGSSEAQPEKPVVPLIPIIAAVLPSIIEAIPTLGKLFGSGSDVQQRNVKAASMAVQIVQEAIAAPNAQAAAEMIQASPELAAVATKAVEARWLELTEAGGGGIDGARKADVAFAATGARVWRSPSFVAMCLMLPLVYLVMGAVIGLYGKLNLSAEVTASIITGLVTLIVGGAAGYYWGSTTKVNTPAPQ